MEFEETRNSISFINEICQVRNIEPIYEKIQEGLPHAKKFIMTCKVLHHITVGNGIDTEYFSVVLIS